MDGLVPPPYESKIKLIWQKFAILYAVITCKDPSDEMIDHYFSKAQEWVSLFTSLHGKVVGHNKANVTPYMHLMVYHVPNVLQMFKTVKLFTGQGVERNNDFARSTVLRKSNNWDGPGDVLKHEARQWELKHREREKRKYNKQDIMYWEYETPVKNFPDCQQEADSHISNICPHRTAKNVRKMRRDA